MRTLAVMHLAEITGPALSLYPRLEELAKRGELVTLVPGSGRLDRLYTKVGPVTSCSYTTLTFPRSLGETVRAIRAIVRDVRMFRGQMRARRPDLVVVATSTLPAALVAARLERVPSIVYVAEILDRPNPRHPGRKHGLLTALLLRLTLWCATAVVCTSEPVTRQFKGRNCVFTIHPGIETPPPSDKRGARRRLGVPKQAFCVSAVGSVSEGRGQDCAIRALPSILESVPNAHLLIVGAPHPRPVDLVYRERLDRLVDDLEIRGRVTFAGFVESVGDVYAATDVLVNPVRIHESASRASLEALAAGRPVVASRIGAIPELLTDEVHALLVSPGDPDEIARAVVRLHGDKDLADRLVAAGRSVVTNRFDERAGVEAFTRVVDAVTDVAARPRSSRSARQ